MNYVHLFFAFSSNFFILIKREALRYYLDCSVTLSPGGLKVEHYLSCTVHLALQHYRGGRPVPRVASYHDGGYYTNANLYNNVWVLPTHLAFQILFKQQNQLYIGISDPRPVKDSC